ncbi:disulfide oxidoreductase, partial [Candidatus Woesearchaeota archaeon]
MRITKKMSFSALLSKYPETIEVFLRYGMHCVGCVAASFETIEQGAKAHGIDPD